jgi:hypothetical protein
MVFDSLDKELWYMILFLQLLWYLILSPINQMPNSIEVTLLGLMPKIESR